MDLLGRESRRLLEEILPRYSPTPGMPPEDARLRALELGRLLQGEPIQMAEVRNLTVEAEDHGIPIRVYRPDAADGAWLLWIHGGGFMTGGLDTHDALCRRLAQGCGQTVISVDYRLAPEHPYPAALNDCAKVLSWLEDSGTRHGLDPARGAIGGSSAGGNLAASLAIRHRDHGEQKLKGQVLVYPCVDASMSMSAAALHGEGYQLTSAMMAHYLHAYCGNEADKRQPALSPLFSPDLTRLPKTLVLIAELDPLAPEGIVYAQRLRAAGVDVHMHTCDGVMHGFFAQAGVLSEARAAQLEVGNFLKAALDSPK